MLTWIAWRALLVLIWTRPRYEHRSRKRLRSNKGWTRPVSSHPGVPHVYLNGKRVSTPRRLALGVTPFKRNGSVEQQLLPSWLNLVSLQFLLDRTFPALDQLDDHEVCVGPTYLIGVGSRSVLTCVRSSSDQR